MHSMMRQKEVIVNGWLMEEKRKPFTHNRKVYPSRLRGIPKTEKPKEKECWEVNIPGWRFISDKKNPLYIRITWAAIILVAFVCVGYQLYLNLQSFLKQPVGVTVEIDQRSEIELPKLMLCPSLLLNLYKANSSCFKEGDCLLGNSNVEQIWSTIKIPEEDLKIFPSGNSRLDGHRGEWPVEIFPTLTKRGQSFLSSIWTPAILLGHNRNLQRKIKEKCKVYNKFLKSETECNKIKYKKESVLTFFGTCYIISFVESLDFIGTYTSIHILIRKLNIDRKIPKSDSHKLKHAGMLYGLFSADEYFPSKIVSLNLYEARTTRAFVTVKKFIKINKRKKGCENSKSVAICISQCVNTMLENKITCRLPYLNISKPLCTMLDSVTASLDIFRIQTNTNLFTQCEASCPKRCTITNYEFYSNNAVETDESPMLSVYFPDNRVFVTKEQLAYPFLQFLSDVGGLLNLTAGLCILLVLTDIHNFIRIFVI